MASPKIVFLDEPTTGLDPLSRMRTWDSIQKLKVGRTVCLTTHSMEEADVLGDTIGILVSGKLRAFGSALYLKNTFGSGYHVTCFCSEDRVEAVLALVRKTNPRNPRHLDIIEGGRKRVTDTFIDKTLKTVFPALR